MKIRYILLVPLLSFAAGCTSSPGQLEGTWRADGLVPMTIIFRPGETESMGVVEHVSYKTVGNAVEVTYKDGLMKGSAMKFLLPNRDTAQNAMLTLHRIQ